MKLILPNTQGHQAWRNKFSFARDELIDSLLAGDWLEKPSPESVLVVQEKIASSFELKFSCFYDDEDARRLRSECLSFTVDFNYACRRDDMAIRNVFFRSQRHHGMGKKFLERITMTALDAGCKKIWVSANIEGSHYWTKSGAIIKEWPGDKEFPKRIGALRSPDKLTLQNWTEQDRRDIEMIIRHKDLAGLNALVDRDDVWVWQNRNFVPLRHYLFENIALTCVFDLNGPLTQQRLLQRTGVDIVAEQAKRGHFVPDAPKDKARGLATKVCEPAF